MIFAFYAVSNSQDYERHTFDDIIDKPMEILEMLTKLRDDEWHLYNLSNPDDVRIFEDDYNNEELDGGYWVVAF